MRTGRIQFAATVAFALATLGAQVALAQTKLKIDVLSSRPELVTGGDALVRVTGGDAAPSVAVDGRDVSASFKADPKGGWVGLVTGLKDGDNKLTVKGAGGEQALTLTNYKVNGPLFAGPQQEPFVCENETFGLDPATDASCAAPAKVSYYYRNKGGEWKPFDPNGQRPSDIGTTKTTEGKEVPLIVRQEKGVINRSAYLINILHDPAAGAPPAPGAASTASGWNGKLVYSFGGGVQANYHMGRSLGMMTGTDNKYFIEDLGGGLYDYFVTRGYAVATGSLNVMGTNNDDVKSAETMAKVKEHFVEEFGAPAFTIGHGASGGSMQQHLIANNYPGLLDGIMPARNYPDTISFLQPLYDCELLQNVFKSSSQKYSREQMDAISGKYWGYCVSNGTRYPNARAENCDASVKDVIANDPKVKALGVRCTYQDNLVNVFGKDPKTGFARNPFDNVGVQYGLVALNEGKITFDQFLDVNQRVGGLDINGKVQPQRMVGDTEALRRAYETGRITGTGALANVPMVDIRSYVDGDPLGLGDPNVDVHDGYHSAVMRARLQKYLGSAANHVMLTAASLGRVQLDTRTGGSPLITVSGDGLAAIDKWLTAVANDKSDQPLAKKVAAHRPADLVDACFPTKQGALVGAIEKITDMEKCKTLFKFSGDARLAAGAPATDDVFKCQLKPVDAKDYKTAPNEEQLAQLRKTFPDGVCDYTKPGVAQVKTGGTWAFFTGDGQYKFLDKTP
ncbi:DUF6351 family protein [Alsobacter sp. SYSU M60028]|uniref:DUF6351 family protein n=1 Tax=Alsobacter ponti TaxID=2962936 RepID=A0ABT1L6B4_9HYPH|nr:DUF6351 family protein [Alsobacter ponti]MCP8936919.1 DUF6351 family protein [Alsobacter ponti]